MTPVDDPVIEQVARRSPAFAPLLRPHLPVTPLRPFAELGRRWGRELLVKCEHRQRTGSFKARGALAKLLTLTPEQRATGVVTASTGNHALGVASALALLGGRGTAVVPTTAAAGKVAKVRAAGLDVRVEGTDAVESEAAARQLAGEHGLVYVPPYNDLDVVAGQGTAGSELVDQLDSAPDAVFVTVGGGGLVSGVGAVLEERWPDVPVVGVSPAADAAMAASVAAGEIVAISPHPTLSEGSAGGIEPGSVTFPLVRAVVDEWVLVEEAEIRAAWRDVVDVEHERVEGAAAAAFAAAARPAYAGARVVVVACGGNITDDELAAALRDPT